MDRQTNTGDRRWTRAAGGAALLYGALALGAATAGAIGAAVPCTGFLCNVGNGAFGAIGGGLAGAVVAAIIGRRLGLRWWFVPVCLVIVVAAFVLAQGSSLPARLGLPLAAAGPAIGAISASRLGRRRALTGIGVLVLLAALVGTGLWAQAQRQESDARTAMVQRARTSGVPLLAPSGRDDLRAKVVSVEPGGPSPSVMYDVTGDGGRTWGRVHLVTGADANSCAGRSSTPLGGGVYVLGDPASTRSVCRTADGVVANLWTDTGNTWQGSTLIDLARALRPDDGSWLASHLWTP